MDVAEAEEAIGLWKGRIPPHRAGYRGNDFLPLVYGEFERLRIERQALIDDFIPLVIGILESQDSNSTEWCNQVDYIIVDEYQDVNSGQQKLIELLAGQRRRDGRRR